MKIAVVIPTYNERENIKSLFERIFSYLPDSTILIVDDNSPDGTAGVVRELQKNDKRIFLLNREKKDGLGSAYRDGFRYLFSLGTFDKIVMMDGDGSHDPSYLPQMVAGGDPGLVTLGSRYVKGGGTENWEFWRRMLSYWGNFYSRLITGLPIKDCTAGFHCIGTKLLSRLPLDKFHASGYAFLIELKYYLWEEGAKFREVPIVFANRESGASKMSNHIIREGIITPWRLRLKDLLRNEFRNENFKF